MICSRCKKLIESGYFRRYTDLESGIVFSWHSETENNCWERARIEVMYAYLDCIRKAARREIK